MRLFRRVSVACLCFTLALVACAHDAAAQALRFPTKPVRMIVAFPPGQAVDIIARLLADELTKAWGHQVVVENRGGGEAIPGTLAGRNAGADGHALTFATSSSFAVNPALFASLPYDVMGDFTMVHGVFTGPWVILASPASPYRSFPDLVAAAKQSPNTLQWGYGATALQLAAELVQFHTGMRLSGVPYKGSGPAQTDLLGGHIGLAVDTVAAALAHVRSGKLKALAILSPKRAPLLPEVPTVAELGWPQVEAEGWAAIAVPRATPPALVDRLGADIGRILADTAVQQKILDRGAVPDLRGPKEMAGFVAGEIAKWTDIARRANVKAQ